MNLFKSGDRVGMKYYDHYAFGEVTIINGETCKVMFDGDFDLDYWYYPASELRLEKVIKEEEQNGK